MTRQELIASIEQYQPYNEQEEMDKPLILEWIKIMTMHFCAKMSWHI